jgi:hypothetical protein
VTVCAGKNTRQCTTLAYARRKNSVWERTVLRKGVLWDMLPPARPGSLDDR